MALPSSIEVLGVTLSKTEANEASETALYKKSSARVEIRVMGGIWSGKVYPSRYDDVVSISGKSDPDDVVKYLEDEVMKRVKWERHMNEWAR